jgi:hypothetical protein
MAITAALVTDGASTTDGTVFTTASVTPTGNQLLLLSVGSAKTGGGEVPDSVVGCGVTWVQMSTALNSRRTTLYRGMVASPSTGTITITFPSTQNSCVWSLSEFGGVDTGGTNGSAATGTESNTVAGTATATSITIGLAAFGDAGNATYGALLINTQDVVTPGTGFTTLSDSPVASFGMRLLSEWRNDNDTSVDASTVGSQSWSGVAVEIFAAAGAAVAGGQLVMGRRLVG